MKKITALFSATVMAATMGLVSIGSTQPAAADQYCNGTISSRRIDDNVKVRRGATCNIVNSYIDGNVITENGARLKIDNSTIKGNVEGFNHYSLEVLRSRVDGNVISDKGNYSLIRSNIVDGNIEIYDNKQPQRIFRNTVDGNIDCQGNRSFITGRFNNVRGNIEGQCRGMKQVSSYQVANKTWRPSSDGYVYIDGFHKIYDTYGTYRSLPNQKSVIQIKRPGGQWVNWTETTRSTNATGYFRAAVKHDLVRGAEVRVFWKSTDGGVTDTSSYAGRIS